MAEDDCVHFGSCAPYQSFLESFVSSGRLIQTTRADCCQEYMCAPGI